MEIKSYIDQKKELYKYFLAFIENYEDPDEDFTNLTTLIQSQNISQNREDLGQFLQLVLSISNNHHRTKNLFTNIERILKFLETEIKQTFSNFDIFNIFIENKLILLFLFKQKIIVFDENVLNSIMCKLDPNLTRFCHFFYPEIKEFVGEEKIKEFDEFSKFDSSFLEDYEEKRQIGENDSYICTLIRQDSVEDFITFVTKELIPLTSEVNPSIFETNPLFIQKNPTLIEYAAFFGSIQIYQFLSRDYSNVDQSLWIYAIHSNDSNFICHYIETNIKLTDSSYVQVINESIKCHHNDIAEYIQNNLLQSDRSNIIYTNETTIFTSLQYHNYLFLPYQICKKSLFFYLCKCNYHKIVNYILTKKKDSLELNANILFLNFF